MKAYYPFLSLIVICFLCLTACEDDDDPNGAAGNIPCKINWCDGEAECDGNTGTCACIDQESQLAPGFCVQNRYKNTFVTYDRFEGCTDTMLVAFHDDPFEINWDEWGNTAEISSYRYNRNVYLSMPYSSGAVFAIRPEDPAKTIDSIFIVGLRGLVSSSCFQEDWFCTPVFDGAFVGRDTIRGVLRFTGCSNSSGDHEDPFPEAFAKKYPMMFTRVN